MHNKDLLDDEASSKPAQFSFQASQMAEHSKFFADQRMDDDSAYSSPERALTLQGSPQSVENLQKRLKVMQDGLREPYTFIWNKPGWVDIRTTFEVASHLGFRKFAGEIVSITKERMREIMKDYQTGKKGE